MYLKKIGYIGMVCCWTAICLHAQTQDSIAIQNYSQPQEYVIADIKVTGAKSSDADALMNVAGLKVGDRIKIPGNKITNALKALWKLGIFSDVQIVQEKTIGELVFLVLQVTEESRLKGVSFEGVKKSSVDQLHDLVNDQLRLGRIITKSQKSNAVRRLQQHFIAQGYADVAIQLQERSPPNEPNHLHLVFTIDKKEKVKIAQIDFLGNTQVSSRKLKKIFGLKTKGQLFAKSKLEEKVVEEGKQAIVAYYNSLGCLDAKIDRDSSWRNAEGEWQLAITIQEGPVYYFGDINWKGNTLYTNDQLSKVLGIQKGDVFDKNKLETQLNFNMGGTDVRSLYMDNGHLFFNIEATQTAIREDTIDLEIRIAEGPIATVDQVRIKGNHRTSEHVIRRELRTEPGKQFSRADIIRSQRQIINLGYFNPESLEINTPIDPKTGTVDIEYVVEEKGADQFELSAGWGGRNTGLTGTVGVSFNNLSLRKLFKPKLWNPMPMGDGQRASIRLQSNGRAYRSLNLSLTEPWLGGKRPNSLTTSFTHSRFNGGLGLSEPATSRFDIIGAKIIFGTRLTFPDDNFVSTTALGIQRYKLQNWSSGLFTTDDGQVITDGAFHNISLTQTIARSTINHPIFPTGGSKFSLSLQLTPPYSLFSKKDNSDLAVANRFNWLEYHKWRFDAEWYTSIIGKLILKVGAKMGFLGSYNSASGTSPFERFQLGGDGLNNVAGGFTGIDIFALRGYETSDLENNFINNRQVATPIFNKFTLELRYPLSNNPNATMWALAFLEAGNSYQSFRQYNPFDLKRSVGVGFRVHLPMLGTLGVDYGLGFDKAGEHSFQNFGKLSVILGFEPN